MTLQERTSRIDWPGVYDSLINNGYARIVGVLTEQECAEIKSHYDFPEYFRSHINMERYNFGRGEYKYFSYPLPEYIQSLRSSLYGGLVNLANNWCKLLKQDVRFPDSHVDFIKTCHASGQNRPTPLLLKYGPGDYNCLHQDLYGKHVFPVQAVALLSEPVDDFDGGEFIITTQRPRKQTQANVVPMRRGDIVLFVVNHRPNTGLKGVNRAITKHGVSQLLSGERYTLGIIFHDAE